MNHIEFIAHCINDFVAQLPPSARFAVTERASAAIQHIQSLSANVADDQETVDGAGGDRKSVV